LDGQGIMRPLASIRSVAPAAVGAQLHGPLKLEERYKKKSRPASAKAAFTMSIHLYGTLIYCRPP